MDHTSYSDVEFEERFFACDISPELFTHEAHLRLGWLLIRRHGMIRAEELLCEGIERFDRVFGDGMKFNRTITVASVRILAHVMDGSTSNEFARFLSEFPRVRTHFRELLEAHYSERAYASPEAARTFLELDLKPFPTAGMDPR